MFLIVNVILAMQFLHPAAGAIENHHPLEKNAGQWNNAYIPSANPADNAVFLGKEEKMLNCVLNLGRYSPEFFSTDVIEPLPRNGYSTELASHMETINARPWLKIVYPLQKARQEIYQDNDTRIIEKLVIPWLLYYTNTYRKENGLDTLRYDNCLLKAASYQTDYLFNESKKSHQFKLVHLQNPNSVWFKGESPSDRALTAGCKKYCGENALYTTISSINADEIKNKRNLNLKAQKIARNMVYDQWHNSKGHRDNMLTADYTCMGVSVAIGKQYIDDDSVNSFAERFKLKDNKNIAWIAFGVQVMAY